MTLKIRIYYFLLDLWSEIGLAAATYMYDTACVSKLHSLFSPKMGHGHPEERDVELLPIYG